MAIPSTNGSRKVNGQFSEGNKYGKGNPHAQKVAQLRTAMIEAVSIDDMQAIVTALVTQAKAGDIQSIKVLIPYLVGSVPQSVNPDELEIEEMKLESRFIDQKGTTDLKRMIGPM